MHECPNFLEKLFNLYCSLFATQTILLLTKKSKFEKLLILPETKCSGLNVFKIQSIARWILIFNKNKLEYTLYYIYNNKNCIHLLMVMVQSRCVRRSEVGLSVSVNLVITAVQADSTFTFTILGSYHNCSPQPFVLRS